MLHTQSMEVEEDLSQNPDLYTKSLSLMFEEMTLGTCDKYQTSICCWFVALRPKSTAMVIAGRSVHLTTLFPGQV